MTRFPAIVETYLSDLRRIRASGGATAEVSSYGPLENLLNAIGDGLRPKVFCVGQLKDQGAGRPDFGLFASRGRTRGGRTNVGALRMEWPRISLPHWSELSARSGTGETDMAAKIDEASDTLADSVARGRDFAALLDPETPVSGVTTGQLRPEIAAIAVPATTHGHNMFGDDFGLTAGWGHFGSGQAVMSGQGRAVERAHTGSERSAPGTALDALRETMYDIHLNDNVYWRNVPANVWNYRLGGYQVLKKWLSYRERKVLGRELNVKEVEYFSEVATRLRNILLITNGEQ